MASIDLDKVRELIEQGHLKSAKHPTADLTILNYSPKTQYEGNWNDLTLMCRGLIVDGVGNIISRPMKKFFSLGEPHAPPIPDEPFEVLEKIDSSMALSYWIDGLPFLASRGSFTSEQAIKATDILRSRYRHVPLRQEFTYVFEVIYPGNRLIVDYGDREDLVLLAVIDTESGYDLSSVSVRNIGFSLPCRYDGIKDIHKLKELEEPNKEGFVIRFESGTRFKVKFDEYVRLHKLLTGLSSKHIWEYLKDGLPLDPLIERVPDEFHEWISDTVDEFRQDYKDIKKGHDINFGFGVEQGFKTRKEWAEYIKKMSSHPAVEFRMLDGRDYSDLIWKQLEPTPENKTFFKRVSEVVAQCPAVAMPAMIP